MADDTIYRQAAIEAVRHSPIIEVQPAYMLIDKADVLKNLVMIPSAQRTGRWIFGHTLGHSWMKCSECLVSQDGQTACFSYCPNCGSRMEVEE